MKITGFAVLMSAALLCGAAPVATEQIKTAPVKTPPAPAAKRNRVLPRKGARPAAKRRQIPREVLISKFNPDAKDATAALNKALRSGAKKIIFDRPGSYFLRPVTVKSFTTIILRPGVKLQTLPPLPDKNGKPQEFPGVFCGNKITRFMIKGEDGNIISGNSGIALFHFVNSNNLTLQNLTLTDGSDAIVFKNSAGCRLENLAIDNFTGTGVKNQGGMWLGITDTQFRNIRGTGVELIANQYGSGVSGGFDNVEFFNSNAGIAVLQPEKVVEYPKNIKRGIPFLSIRSCRFFNNTGSSLYINGNATSGKVRIENCLFSDNRGTSLHLADFNQDSPFTLTISNTIFRPQLPFIMPPLLVSSRLPRPLGNISITNTNVIQQAHLPAIKFDLKHPAGKIDGTLPVTAPDGKIKHAQLILTQEK